VDFDSSRRRIASFLSSGLKVGKSPAGKALRFVHRGSHDSIDTTYELIANYLDDEQLKRIVPPDVELRSGVADLEPIGSGC
jgi:hypothetical protein